MPVVQDRFNLPRLWEKQEPGKETLWGRRTNWRAAQLLNSNLKLQSCWLGECVGLRPLPTQNLADPAFSSVLSGDWGWSLPTLGMVFPFLLWLVCSWAEHQSVWIEPGLKFWHPWAATKQQPPKCHTVYGKKWAVSACFFPLCGYKRRSTSASQRYETDFRTNSGLERWAGYQMVSLFLWILRF